jgi:hypothetical protein
MKVLKIINPLLFLFLSHFLAAGSTKKLIPVYNYNDTIVEFENYTVELRNTYLRKKLFLRTSVVINNKSDNFLLLNPEDVLFSTEKLKNSPSLYYKTIVIPPHYTKKFTLKFDGSDYTSKVVHFNFSKIKASHKTGLLYKVENMKLEKGEVSKLGNLKLRVDEKKLLPDALLVVVVVDYTGENFLAINFNNIGVHQTDLPSCYNLRRNSGRFNFNPDKNRETIKLLFSRDCFVYDGKKKMLSFDNVFTEYSTTTLEGFNMSLRLVSEGEREPDKKDDIEEIN